MWVHEEEVKGRSLSNLINEKRENVRYLPGIDLPQNLVASSNIEARCCIDWTTQMQKPNPSCPYLHNTLLGCM